MTPLSPAAEPPLPRIVRVPAPGPEDGRQEAGSTGGKKRRQAAALQSGSAAVLNTDPNLCDLNGTPWLWCSGAAAPNSYAWFSRSFDLVGPPAAAPVFLSADKSYKLYVNGAFVLMGPMREEKPYFYYDAVDLAPFLRVGRNVLAILVHSRAGFTAAGGAATAAGLLFQGRVVSPDGTALDLTPPEAWSCGQGTARAQTSHKLGDALGVGYSEDFDCSRDDAGAWLRGEGQGVAPVILGRHPAPPFLEPLARDLPRLSGKSFTAQSVVPHEKGWLADFGREVFGFVHLTFKTLRPTTFSVAYAEHLTGDSVDFRKAGMDYRDVLHAPVGTFSWTSYEKRACRYLFLDEAELDVTSLEIREYGYPYVRENLVPVHDPDGIKRKILEVSARTIELCSDDLLNDCPWRERTQYLDPYAYLGAMKKLFGTLEPARKFLRQFARGAGTATPMPMCYPAPRNTTVIPDFVMLYAVTLKKYFDLSGDLDTVRACFDVARRTVEHYRANEDGDGLLADVPGWIFLDNTFELCKTGRSSGLNAIYAGSLQALAELALALGDTALAAELEKRFSMIRNAFRKAFLKDGSLLDSDRSPDFLDHRYWNYHYPADGHGWEGKSFLLKTELSFPAAGRHDLRLSFFGGCRAWLDGTPVLDCASGGGWTRAPLFHPQEITVAAAAGPHRLVVEVGHSPIDWEFFLFSREDLHFGNTAVAPLTVFGSCHPDDSGLAWKETRLRPFVPARLSQVSVALASLFGMLEVDEARRLLAAVLPERYYANFRKRTTPYFVEITEDAECLRRNVLPCNTPWSLNFLCQALARHGMSVDAEALAVDSYRRQLALGATSWWEEWGAGSSLCHAWGSFVAEYIQT